MLRRTRSLAQALAVSGRRAPGWQTPARDGLAPGAWLAGIEYQRCPCQPSTSGRVCEPDCFGVRRVSTSRWTGAKAGAGGGETISVTFINRDGSEQTIAVPLGMNMLEAAHANDIELEGACEGSLACSTCHVIVEQEDLFRALPEPVEDEEDMLDLAFGLTETSRLGCQIIATKEIDGVRLRIPAATRNMAVDGYVPKPH